MKKTVIILFLVIGIIGAVYYVSVNNPSKTAVIANGHISEKAIAYSPSSVSIQYNESRAPNHSYDLSLSVDSTFFIDQGISEVLEIADDYIQLYNATGVTHIITVNCSLHVG